jgi:hypothetical protein
MDPQPAGPQPTNNYDFILNPQAKQKRKLLGGIGGNSFIAKLALIIGGAVVVMIVLSIGVNLLFGSKTNLETLVGLVKTEQEITRVSDAGKDAADQEIKNSALNTQLVTTSHQRTWLVFLSKRGREVKKDELNLKKSASTDRRLATAKQTSTFDTTYNTLMRSSLTDYAKEIKAAYLGASNKQEREILNNQYKDVQLLLKQWPETSVGLAGN